MRTPPECESTRSASAKTMNAGTIANKENWAQPNPHRLLEVLPMFCPLCLGFSPSIEP
jgi:hypothetical protein